MKYIILTAIFVTTVLFSEAQYKAKHLITNQEKAEALVKNYLLEHLNNPHSYENVGFTPIDTLYNDIDADGKLTMYENKLYKIVNNTIPKFKGAIRLSMELPGSNDLIKPLKDSLRAAQYDSISTQAGIDIIHENYVKRQIGWRMLHRYRARNAYNALMLETDTVNINPSITKILNMNRVKEN